MKIDKDIYSIHAIRLVNFHNINHVTIPINEGGHLFLLGDNGSGKTTIIDAVHYILSAGEQVELNSAARLGGSKHNGRRINGVVTRYNIDCGNLCKDGRVTYAVLELKNNSCNFRCIGIGLSVSNENAPLQQWGFKSDLPISELPILIKDSDGNEYPPNREEFKKICNKQNFKYFSSMKGFADEIARDFFPSQSQYIEYRKFLNMCKAYREISSRAGNYHELFKSLLPEPDREATQELILRLKNLQESDITLKSLRKKCEYLKGLFDEKLAIDNINKRLQILDLSIQYFDCENKNREIKLNEEKLLVMQGNLADFLIKKEQKEKSYQDLERTINDLKASDSTSLIENEKNRTKELERILSEIISIQEKIKSINEITIQEDLNNRELLQNYDKVLTDLAAKFAENLIAYPNLPLKTAQDNIQNSQVNKLSYKEFKIDSLEKLNHSFGGDIERMRVQLDLANQKVEKAAIEVKKTNEKLVKLETQEEAIPEQLYKYGELLEELTNSAIVFAPLYSKLHWKKGLSTELKSKIEELITENVLGTIVAEQEYSSEIKELLINEYSGHRFAELYPENELEPTSKIREFLENFFDSSKDTAYLTILARELDGLSTPIIYDDFIQWRGSFRTLNGFTGKLIGEEERKAEQKRKIKEAKEELKDKHKLLTDAQKLQKIIRKRLDTLKRFKERFDTLFSNFNSIKNSLINSDSQLKNYYETAEKLSNELIIKQQNAKDLEQNLFYLRQQINDKNLKSLNEKINSLSLEFKKVENEKQESYDKWHEQSTRCNDRIEIINDQQNEFNKLNDYFSQNLALSKECRNLEALKKFLEIEKINNKTQTQAKITLDNSTRSGKFATIKERINFEIGIDYGFTYDEISNELFSREHRTIKDIYMRLQEELDTQETILTQERREQFKKILLEGFRETLQARIFNLEDMQLQINRKLKNHKFGNHTYSLQIKPQKEYTPMVNILKKFSEQISEHSDELQKIIDDNSSNILETVPGQIPKSLDYRNYFNYNIILHSATSNGLSMDNRTKSLGSGGEQAVPNYLLVLMIAHLLFKKSSQSSGTNSRIKINTILFDEAFYGIDSSRQDQLLSFAEELGLQLMIASPAQDGMKNQLENSTNVIVSKDINYDAHLIYYGWHRNRTLLVDENELINGVELT